MLCRQGPSERRSRPWLREGAAAKAVGRIAQTGCTAPTAPAGQPCLDDELFPRLTTPIRHWPKQKNAAWYCGKLRCLSKTWLHLRDKSTRILWDIHVVWTRALWFSTLLATAVLYYLLTIRKLANSTNAKRQVRKGVLAWAFGRSIHITHWHTINYNKKTKPTNVKRVENYSHTRKYNRVENYTHT